MLRTAVIPAAGLGTRMLPAAKAVPKELLTIVDRPAIQYVVEEAAAGGVADVVLVTSARKPAVAEHFAWDEGLHEQLRAKNRGELLASLRAIRHVAVRTVDQPHQCGLGDAVRCAQPVIAREPFLCMLGDAVFSGEPSPVRQMRSAFEALGTAIIGVQRVPPEKVSRYGIVAGPTVMPGVIRIEQIVEKPSREQAPSDLAIAARYILTPAIFDCLNEISPGKDGEIQLTDALHLQLSREPIHAVILESTRHDIGDPLDWLRTNLIFARSRPDVWDALSPTIRSLL